MIGKINEFGQDFVDAARQAYERRYRGLLDDGSPHAMNELRLQMGRDGFCGMTLPRAYGGLELPLLTVLRVTQAFQVCDMRLGSLSHQFNTGPMGAVAALAPESLRQRYVVPLCRGELTMAIGITEPHAGSAATGMKTKARIEGDELVINGSKIFVSNVTDSACTLLYCRFGDSGTPKDIGAVIVPHDAPGFAKSKGTLNMAGELQYELFFDNCRLPADHIVVQSNAFARLIRHYNGERLGSVARMLGNAEFCLGYAVSYVKERQQFGRDLADFQGLQWMIADMKVKLEAAQLLTYRAAANAHGEEADALETSLAKVYVSQAAKEICDDALQLLGGYGYMTEYPIEHRLRETRGGAIYGGTAQIHRNMIAGHVLGRSNSQWKH
jgi:alkylation response protein AidB-like acyl-CoA dehydrogenase